MKQFFEFIPLIIFFAIYKMVDIYAATASLMVTTGLMLAYNYFKNGKAEKMHEKKNTSERLKKHPIKQEKPN